MSQKPKRGCAVIAPGLIAAGLLAGIDPNPVRAQATASDDAAIIRELQQRLEEQEVVIDNLLWRVQELERRLGPGVAAQTPPAAPEQPALPAVAAPAVPEAEPAPPAPPPTGEATASAPGQFEVDEEAIDRALEQALVRTGALLLPPGTVEIEPSLSYIRRESSTPGFFARRPALRLAARLVPAL